jgi:hypothetical protein
MYRVFFIFQIVLAWKLVYLRSKNRNALSNTTDMYFDCESRSIDQLRETFQRDGIVMFTPCSLQSHDLRVVDGVKAFMSKECPGQRSKTGCKNRIVKSNNAAVLDLAINEEVLLVLSLLYGGRSPFPFQTLNFKFGTGQPMHSDLIHFAGYPSLTMTAAWVALEDVSEHSGPLTYFLRSHREKFQTMSDLSCPPGKYSTCYEAALAEYISINKHNWTEAHMLPRKGQVVIWDSNLIHGGGFVRNEAITRMSQVTHYFFDDDEFFFQPKLSESDGTQFYKVSMRADVPVGLSARDIIDLHWQSHGLRYKGHYATYFSSNLHSVQLQDLQIPVTALE